MASHLRIARPVKDLSRTRAMYCTGLGWSELGSFEDHAGFDGVMIGDPSAGHHFEFTVCRMHPVAPAPTVEDLIVLYLPERDEWKQKCDEVIAAGLRPVASMNPYWERNGRTFEDADGYRIVLQNDAWE